MHMQGNGITYTQLQYTVESMLNQAHFQDDTNSDTHQAIAQAYTHARGNTDTHTLSTGWSNWASVIQDRIRTLWVH